MPETKSFRFRLGLITLLVLTVKLRFRARLVVNWGTLTGVQQGVEFSPFFHFGIFRRYICVLIGPMGIETTKR